MAENVKSKFTLGIKNIVCLRRVIPIVPVEINVSVFMDVSRLSISKCELALADKDNLYSSFRRPIRRTEIEPVSRQRTQVLNVDFCVIVEIGGQ